MSAADPPDPGEPRLTEAWRSMFPAATTGHRVTLGDAPERTPEHRSAGEQRELVVRDPGDRTPDR